MDEEDLIYDINKAIVLNNTIKFSYTNNKGECSTREIFPFCMYDTGFSVLLKGFCFLRNEERVFNIDRIEDFETIEKIICDKELIELKIEAITENLYDGYY